MAAEYKIEVKNDRTMPTFWEVCVYQKGASEPVFREYGDSEEEARAKGEAYVTAKTAGRGKQFIGDNGGSNGGYTTINEVLAAYNNCELTFRQAADEMQRINPSLSANDIQDVLVNDNSTPPDCDGDGKPAGEDDDGDTPPADDWGLWPLTDENRFMLIGVLVLYLLYYYGRD